MEVERPHYHNNSTSELFICFTSRLSSSSSMKLSSKSILSPGRSRESPQISLSTSLSRRLRNNGSIKGGNGQASPMFPTTGKKRGCAFENPEPSSPKVTCIGQVRVKTKKQGKKMRARSKKRRGEASFRKTEQGFSDLQNLQQEAGLTHRNQRWVHLPLTICEALRAFGAEFSCLFPCRSSSCGREKDEEEKMVKGEGSDGGQSRDASCGAAFARWLVALQEGEAKGRQIELVVGEENVEEEDDDDRPETSRRRHVFEDIEIDTEKNNEEEEDKARVSICIPPKNALLLMRCRSDPVKMAALANRFWESPAPKDEEVEQDDELQREEEDEHVHMEEGEEQDRIQVQAVEEDCSICEISNEELVIPEAEVETEEKSVIESYESETEIPTTPEISEVAEESEEKQEFEEEEVKEKEVEVEIEEGNSNLEDEDLCDNSREVVADLEKPKLEESHEEMLQEKENCEDICGNELKFSEPASSSPVVSVASESESDEVEEIAEISVTPETAPREGTAESTEKEEGEGEEEKETEERPREDESTATQDTSDPQDQKSDEQKQGPVLPDYLLSMMCEPKLSMEVSKETWVCSTDFVRWLPERPAEKRDSRNEPKKRISIDAKPPLGPPLLMQPPRSSCSFPAPAAHGGGMSMASMIEQKLVGSNPYEPFVLTRCKSEPMRSSTKLAPEACCWNNRKLEPHHHRPATFGVGAAGVGF